LIRRERNTLALRSAHWSSLEARARESIQGWLQDVLEEDLLSAMQQAETPEEAERMRDRFVARYMERAPKAGEQLLRDWERLVRFHRFPKEHWKHLRTSNVVESPFAAVRLRTGASKRFKLVENVEAIIRNQLTVAEKRFRKLNAPHLLAEVAAGVAFEDGIRKTNRSQAHAA
jgi:transposase-like protein